MNVLEAIVGGLLGIITALLVIAAIVVYVGG